MKVLIAGATGLIGQFLLKECLNDNDVSEVHVIGRQLNRLENHPKLKKHEIPFEDLEQFTESIDVCFCCLGTTIKKAGSKEKFALIDKKYPLLLANRFQAISEKGKFLIISAMGASVKSSIFYNKVKGEVEEELQKMNLFALYILRPSLLLGERSEDRFFEGLAQKILPYIPAPKNYKPIHGRQVAKKMLELAKLPVEDQGHRILLNGEILS